MKTIRYLLAFIGIVNILCIKAQVKGKVVEVSQKNDTTVVPGVILVWNKTSIAITFPKVLKLIQASMLILLMPLVVPNKFKCLAYPVNTRK